MPGGSKWKCKARLTIDNLFTRLSNRSDFCTNRSSRQEEQSYNHQSLRFGDFSIENLPAEPATIVIIAPPQPGQKAASTLVCL